MHGSCRRVSLSYQSVENQSVRPWAGERAYTMANTYTLKVAGLERELPLCEIDKEKKVNIAAFIIFGDVELTVVSAKALLHKCPDFDIIVTPEAKSIPLAYEMARQSGKPYVVARKSTKLYMRDPISVSVRSITTDREQRLYLGQDECEMLRGKRVLVVDDVISTGESLLAVEKLVKEVDGVIAASAAILAEGDAAKRTDIISWRPCPCF